MFGIMRPEGGCSNKNNVDYRFHRMHYCGVCKAMGKSYGHKSRLLLNYDSVFMAELISELKEDELDNWEPAFQAINKCLTMPKQQTPVSLQYAADANILLADLKVQDQLFDNASLGWRFAQKFFNRPFLRNAQKLAKWGLDKKQLLNIGELQLSLEKSNIEFGSVDECIEYYANPTARLTAFIFGNAAEIISKPEIKSKLTELGYNFGKMAYLLDAFVDFDRDIKKNQFNPIAKYYMHSERLTEHIKDQINSLLEQQLDLCNISLKELIPQRSEIYFSRLRSNVMLQMYSETKVETSFREKLALRWHYSRNFAAEMSCADKSGLASKLRYQMLSVAVFVAPKTPEFMGVSRDNSMFSWTAFLAAFLAAIGLGVIVGRKKRKRQERKKNKKFKNFMMAIRSGYFLKRGCWEEVLSICCAACACGCFEICCETGCSGCCSKTCEDSRSRRWIWIFLAFLVLVGAITAILLSIL